MSYLRFNFTDDLNIEKRGITSPPFCKPLHICSVSPYHYSEFGHYIGYTDEDYKNIVICRKYNANGCVARERYDRSSMDAFVVQDHSYLNPFNDGCGKSSNYTVNFKDKNSYYAAYGNKVLVKNNNKIRIGGERYRVNNRCLVENGWCPC
ncbi:hypothetical protein PIROE2DRAFT_9522 [Piromyces sp. E2]|nr:hypothetical protein PIROE2DRAFT_9522 [Piromyces sp. E2]|eukprot:OUM63853.1 hypothetical protein PIROE2DRAFT_9522 [Piromyces sp. E2]